MSTFTDHLLVGTETGGPVITGAPEPETPVIADLFDSGVTPWDAPHRKTDPDRAETACLELDLPPLEDAYSMLHHSCRREAVQRQIALPGQYLGFADGQGDEWLIPLEKKVIHLGRSHNAEIRLEDIRVSRRHAIIARYGGQVRVLDDASTKGTFVNGRSVIAVNLSDGDVIRLGPVAFRYVVVR